MLIENAEWTADYVTSSSEIANHISVQEFTEVRSTSFKSNIIHESNVSAPNIDNGIAMISLLMKVITMMYLSLGYLITISK